MRDRVPPDQADRQADWRQRHPPVPTPTPHVVTAARRVIFCAEAPSAMNDSPSRMTAAPTADPGYREHLTHSLVAYWREQGRLIRPWCDCRHTAESGLAAEGEPTGTPLSEAFKLTKPPPEGFGLDAPIGQAESALELRHATGINQDGSHMTWLEREAEFGCGPTVDTVAGNPNAWTDKQRETVTVLVNAGVLAVIVECYTNVQGPWPDGFTTQGVPVASFLLGVYDGKLDAPNSDTARYISGAEYLQHTPPEFKAGVGVYHAASNREGWAWLP